MRILYICSSYLALELVPCYTIGTDYYLDMLDHPPGRTHEVEVVPVAGQTHAAYVYKKEEGKVSSLHGTETTRY